VNLGVNRSLELSTGRVGGWWEREGSEYTDKSRVILAILRNWGKKYQEVGFSRQGGASRSFGRCVAVFDARDKISVIQ